MVYIIWGYEDQQGVRDDACNVQSIPDICRSKWKAESAENSGVRQISGISIVDVLTADCYTTRGLWYTDMNNGSASYANSRA